MIKLVLLLMVLMNGIVCPPPLRKEAQRAQEHDSIKENESQNKAAEQEPSSENKKPMYEFAYSKYLEEVVQILESDPKFNEKLKTMNQDDIKAGNIADHIDDLDKEVFDKLHKAKFAEIERLREQIAKQIEADGGAHNVKMPEHLDVQEIEKFSKEDLRKLIQKTVADMNEIDKQRREDFKKYEMEKKAEEDHKVAQMSPEEREKAKREHEESAKRHNDHEKLKHPGSRDQLQDVWEESDHLEKEAFDSRTFFALHDLNGDGFWNDAELEALFQLELQKMYNETNPDDDPKERMEEMYRMREHVSKQMDKNGDRLISLDEFLADTEAQTPNKDEGWKDLGQEQVYTDEELQAFEKEYAKQQGSETAHPAQPNTEAQQQTQPPPPIQNAVPQQQQHQVPPAQNVPPVQPVNHQQNAANINHAPIQDHEKDSRYGI